jgi:hypothetical protein
MQRDRLPYILFPLAALIAVLPLILHGCSCGHDFDFHILNWLEAARQFTHGNLHPHWAYTPAWNAGEPRFVFYPPLSWTIGALLGLTFPWTWTPILYTWLALTASGLALHRLARDLTTPTAALLVATFYVVNPYMLFTAYERTAYAELLAAAWIPLLLHAILREKVTIPRIAIPVALLWLTNAPAAVMSCYALALLTIIRITSAAIYRQATTPGATSSPTSDAPSSPTPGAPSSARTLRLRWASRDSATASAHSRTVNTSSQTPLQLALNAIAGTLLGLGVASIYLIPAAYERRYVQIAMAILPGMRIQDNFLFHHTGDILHDQVLHTASTIAVTLIVLTAAFLSVLCLRSTPPLTISNLLGPSSTTNPGAPSSPRLLRLRWASRKARPSSSQNPATSPTTVETTSASLPLSLAILTAAIAFLLLPASSSIWNHLPEVLFLQFPWRLLAILAAVLSLTAAIILRALNLKPVLGAALAIAIAAALTYPAYTVFHQSCDDEDTVQAREALFHSNQGTDPTDEYTPTTADNDSLAHANPAFWLSPDANAKAPANSTPGPAPTHLTLNSPTPQTLILNVRNYPTWHVTLNGAPVITQSEQDQRDDGLIAIPIPAGPSMIDIAYAHPLDQTFGNTISLVSLALLFFALHRRSPLASPVE